MSETFDYAGAGLIAGLEVHQQLLTDHKLFCRCPAGRYTREHDGTVLRHMRPTLSELGEYDGTALMEFKTRKNIIYLLNRVNTCTYEMDDTPPFLVDERALDIAIEQCLMLGCDIVDEVHIARKQYLDGSIPTGFQRTAVIGVNGSIPFCGRRLTITQVTLEEDSCREVSDRGHLIVWRTDRLGMPLIETVTGPELRTPGEVEAAILLIGRICRSTGHVRTGIGASRQDVNVSVRGGRRVEIKGVPKASWARRLVHGEAIRQVNLLRLRDELHRRGLSRPEDLGVEHRDVTELFRDSAIPLLRRERWERWVEEQGRRPGFELGEGPFTVRAVRLRGLAGVLGRPTQPGRDFAHELAGRVRVIATLDQAPILLHDGSWPRSAAAELAALRRQLGCAADDAVAVVWGPERDTVTAAGEIRLRLEDALDGVPNETRQPFADGSTDFERILPGPDRMYPDTDSPPQPLAAARVAALRRALPAPPWEREAAWTALGVPAADIDELIRHGGSLLVDRVVREAGADPRFACFFFAERLKALRRAGHPVDAIPPEGWVELFRLFTELPVSREAWRELTTAAAADPGRAVREIARETGIGAAPDGWEEEVARLARSARPEYPDGTRVQLLRFLMGAAMARLRGRVAAARVAETLIEALEAGS
ncbi:MAG TPA: Glu-tRNA(Gln) amidotransferase subunit GatE [Acidobacteria bacterium]|nr:Glu-tRNA(Gln) amidotransferase subunit GatE [Acidobacteriota bacterium]